MIRFNSILPSGLLVACALIFLGCQPQDKGGATATPASENAGSGMNIVFIRLDSLQTGYTELAGELKRLEDNAMLAQENIQKQIAALEKEVRGLQNQVQQGLLAPNRVQAEQQRIAQREQQIAQQRDLALGSIQEDQMRLQAQFGDKVKAILETLREEKGYDYILNQSGGSAVLVADDAHDITDLVLERLNASPATPMATDTVQ
ncbi:OmpH family outer membrane protein [Neolewinella lacunae]|uniref:OmpH family outer membrane protein n=1 Tax=Neolewinella lacunae TaxID=1517758 RepID=A0A923T8D0_9BACT|nr:OmpH family outer membrane protein [Neolewinella lacunae]MBC6995485.1 OmpH family outer membrane protein [Neolewinella lacunae]MDN3635073.1 OmpH family outer membrane protein [Neolewinella lacunae]